MLCLALLLFSGSGGVAHRCCLQVISEILQRGRGEESARQGGEINILKGGQSRDFLPSVSAVRESDRVTDGGGVR